MNIDREKHQKTEIDALDMAIESIDRIYDEAISLVKDDDLKEIIEIAVRWYENKEIRDNPENLLYYTFFNDAFPADNGPSDYYGGLGSFLSNCILDDSYYELKWKVHNPETGNFYEGGEAWNSDPYVEWSNDDKGTQNSHTMLEGMRYAIKRAKERFALQEECTRLKEEWANGKQAK